MTQVNCNEYFIICYLTVIVGAGIRVNPVDGEHILMGFEADTGVNYLEIIEVTRNDVGIYICVVTTKLGMTESTFALEVNDPEIEVYGMQAYVHVTMYHTSQKHNESTLFLMVFTNLITNPVVQHEISL